MRPVSRKTSNSATKTTVLTNRIQRPTTPLSFRELHVELTVTREASHGGVILGKRLDDDATFGA